MKRCLPNPEISVTLLKDYRIVMWIKSVLISNILLSICLIGNSIEFPEYFILKNPVIIKNCIASEGRVWNTQTKKLIFSSEFNVSLTETSIFCSDGTNTSIYRNTDGSLVTKIPGLDYSFNQASSLLWAYSGNKFVAFSDNGQSIANLNLTADKIFPYPNEVRYARGNSIYKYSYAGSAEQFVGSFSGIFASWFLDGEYFLTKQEQVVRLYDKNGLLIKLIDVPATDNMGGTGTYVWSYDNTTSTPNASLFLFRTNSTVILKYPLSVSTKVFPSVQTIGIIPYGSPRFSIIELVSSEPLLTTREGSGPYLLNYNSDKEGNWATSNNSGVVNYGTLTSQPVTLNLGKIRSLYGNINGHCAVATASGNVLVYHMKETIIETVDTFIVNSSKVKLSDDGKYLFCGNSSFYPFWEGDLSLSVYDVESHQLIKKFYHNYIEDKNSDYLFDFDSSPDGLLVSQRTGYFTTVWSYNNYLSDLVTGDSIDISGTSDNTAPRISPTKEYVATSTTNGTRLFRSGILNNVFTGRFIGWISNTLFIVNELATVHKPQVYSVTGEEDSRYKLPFFFQSFSIISDSVLLVDDLKVINIKTGETLYTFDPEPDFSVPIGPDHILYTEDNTIKNKNWRLGTGKEDIIPDVNSPYSLYLGQNFPNPFENVTSLQFNISGGGKGNIKIYNSTGELVLNEIVTGNGTFTWNSFGKASGMYICHFSYKNHFISRKLVKVK